MEHYCYHCYGLNAGPRGPCAHCGREIEMPPGATYDDQLIWALAHPVSDTAMMAARTLEHRRPPEATEALRRTVLEQPDPYLQAAALRALIAIVGVDDLRATLIEIAGWASFIPARVAREALAAAD